MASRGHLLWSTSVCVLVVIAVLVRLPPGFLSDATCMTVAVAIAALAWWGASADPGRRRALRPVALMLGLLRRVRAHQRGRRDDVDGLIALAAMFVVTLLLAWVVAIAPTLADDTLPLSTRLVWSLCPALDAALLALLVRTVATRRHLGVLVLLIAAGVACWLAADPAYLATGLAAGYSIWLDAGWLLGGLLMAVATWQPATGPAPNASAPEDLGIGRVRIAVALAPLLVPPAILLNEHLRGADIDVVPVGVLTVVLVALAYSRALRLLHDATEAREAGALTRTIPRDARRQFVRCGRGPRREPPDQPSCAPTRDTRRSGQRRTARALDAGLHRPA